MTKLLALMLALSLFAAACGDDDDDAPVATTTTEAEATTTTEAAAEGDEDQEAIAEAYLTLFSKETPRDEAVAALEDVDGKDAIVAGAEENTSDYTKVVATVKSVEVDGDTADVVFDLLLTGSDGSELPLPDQAGKAVKQDGEWKVAAETLCALLTISGAPPECDPHLPEN